MKTPDQKPPSESEALSQSLKDTIDYQFEHFSTGLYSDTINAWPLGASESDIRIRTKGPAEHYEEYLRGSQLFHKKKKLSF